MCIDGLFCHKRYRFRAFSSVLCSSFAFRWPCFPSVGLYAFLHGVDTVVLVVVSSCFPFSLRAKANFIGSFWSYLLYFPDLVLLSLSAFLCFSCLVILSSFLESVFVSPVVVSDLFCQLSTAAFSNGVWLSK